MSLPPTLPPPPSHVHMHTLQSLVYTSKKDRQQHQPALPAHPSTAQPPRPQAFPPAPPPARRRGCSLISLRSFPSDLFAHHAYSPAGSHNIPRRPTPPCSRSCIPVRKTAAPASTPHPPLNCTTSRHPHPPFPGTSPSPPTPFPAPPPCGHSCTPARRTAARRAGRGRAGTRWCAAPPPAAARTPAARRAACPAGRVGRRRIMHREAWRGGWVVRKGGPVMHRRAGEEEGTRGGSRCCCEAQLLLGGLVHGGWGKGGQVLL